MAEDNKTRVEYICAKRSCAKKGLRCLLIQRDKTLTLPDVCPFDGKIINWKVVYKEEE